MGTGHLSLDYCRVHVGSALGHPMCKIAVFQLFFILQLSAVSVPQFLEGKAGLAVQWLAAGYWMVRGRGRQFQDSPKTLLRATHLSVSLACALNAGLW